MRDSRQFRQSLKKQDIPLTDKQINYFIHEIEPKHNRNDQYQKALATWNQFLASYKLELKQATNILKAEPKHQPTSTGSDLCQVCYEEMTRKKNWCRICGNECCEKCIARLRILTDVEQPVLFCQKCDKDYMIAMIVKQEQQKFALREKAFLRLADEQQMIESLLKIERQKLTGTDGEGAQKNEMLKRMNKITELNADNHALKSEILQTKRKIDWGDEIKFQLKKKLKKIKRSNSHSFASSTHEEQDGWAPPKVDAEDYVSAQNLNESIINSILQTQTQSQQKQQPFKCTCTIF